MAHHDVTGLFKEASDGLGAPIWAVLWYNFFHSIIKIYGNYFWPICCMPVQEAQHGTWDQTLDTIIFMWSLHEIELLNAREFSGSIRASFRK